MTVMLLLLAATALKAQIPSGYYDNAAGKSGDELKTALHNIIKGHTSVGYSGLWNAYKTTDLKANGKIWDIYSNIEYTPGSGQCGTYQKEGDCYNREHTWPQSWFNEQETPKADLFHVYPTDGKVNGVRSSYPYGEVGTATYTSTNGSKLGNCTTTGYSGTVFEPADDYKGDIARGFFYMSVRYYTEDDSWGTSDMTNKSVILDWAMTMLLRWADEDPVSEKEINRNNAVYGKQHNRNPFIDHPEYARMIWDPNYTAATSYNITCATGLSGGSISAPATAAAGTTVSLTATPNPGYELASWTVYKTGSPSTTVTVSSNGTFIMPEYAVTVSATFRQNTTQYNIACNSVNNGTISTSATSAMVGTTITLTATPATGYALYAWYVYKTGDSSTQVAVSGNTFVMPAYNVTVTASFAEAGGTGDYVKVTSNSDLTSGQYLIVYESSNVAFNGGLTTLDATSNTVDVTISNNTIASTSTTDAASFTIDTSAGTIKSASGYYIGQTSDNNGMNSNQSTAYTNRISFNGTSVDIVGSGGAYLRYNADNNNKRFRYFKSSTYSSQQPIQLYKKTVNVTQPTHTVTFHYGTSSYPQTVNENEPTSLKPNTFTNDGYVFDGWKDNANNYYADGATVTLLADLDLYAQWNWLFSITCIETEHGTVSANVGSAVEDATVTLTATPEEGYQFYFWTVTDAEGNTIDVTDNQFEMPASNVTVTAVFVYVGEPTGDVTYQLVTSTDQLTAGKKVLIVNTTNGKALSTTQNNNNRGAATVAISDNTISSVGNACELTLGGSSGAWTFYDGSGYLYAASSSDNYLRTQTTNNANGQWAIIVTNNEASIVAQGTNTRNSLQYNKNNDIFSCYASNNTMQPVSLFIETASAAPSVIFADNDEGMTAKNSDLLTANDNQTVNAVLYGRTLYKDNHWNTLCLPFNLAVSGSVLDGATVMELSSASISGSTLTLNFEAATSLTAGKPYIVKWTSGSDITSPVFENVKLKAGNPTASTFSGVSFEGSYAPVTIGTDGDNTMLYLGDDDTLYYPDAAMTIGAFRACFHLDGYTAGSTAPTRFVLNFDNDETAIRATSNCQLSTVNCRLYDLQGRRMANSPLGSAASSSASESEESSILNSQLKKGVYISNGRKVVKK